MSSAMSVAACRAEAKVVVVLLDAAEAAGLFAEDDLLRRWSELKGRCSPSDDFVAEAVPLWQLLSEIMSRPEAQGHWIERRWREVEARMRATHGPSRRRTIR
jgi:hypothetical protein